MTSRAYLVLTLLVAGTAWLSPLQRQLFVGDETKYGQVIREMRASGELIVPTLEGRPYTHKPPVHFWMIWALTFVFGTSSIWPFVLPSLIAYLLLIALIYRLARELIGDGTPAAFVFSSMLLAWGLAQTARMDLSFTLLITAAAWSLWRWLQQPLRSEDHRLLLLAGVAVGLAILIKGPMAAVMVLILAIAQMVRRRKGWRAVYLAPVAIAAALPLLWLIPAMLAGGNEYSREILVDQNVGRAVGSWVHQEPPWFYLQHYPVLFLPWSLLGIVALTASWRLRRTEESGALLFCIDWILAVLVPFSLLSSKLDVYMLPAMVPFAILAGWFLVNKPGVSYERWGRIAGRVISGLFALLFLVVALAGPSLTDRPADRELLASADVQRIAFLGFIVAAVGLAMQTFWRPRSLEIISAIAALVVLAPLVWITTVGMAVANREVSSAPLVGALRTLTTEGSEVGLYGAPHLWSRDLPPSFHHVRYLGEGALAGEDVSGWPRLIAVRRDRAAELGSGLARYSKVGEVRLKGKPYDVYRGP